MLNVIKCSVIDGIPEPIIDWKLSDGSVLSKYSRLIKSIVFENVNKYTSELEITAPINWDGKSVECYIKHPSMNKIMSDNKYINLTCK